VTLILAGVYARQSLVTPLKRACIDWSGQLPGGRQSGSWEARSLTSEHLSLAAALRPVIQAVRIDPALMLRAE
jgi:hypothetical protein